MENGHFHIGGVGGEGLLRGFKDCANSSPISIVRQVKVIICKHLRPPAVGPTAFGRSAPEKRRGIEVGGTHGAGWVEVRAFHPHAMKLREGWGTPELWLGKREKRWEGWTTRPSTLIRVQGGTSSMAVCSPIQILHTIRSQRIRITPYKQKFVGF